MAFGWLALALLPAPPWPRVCGWLAIELHATVCSRPCRVRTVRACTSRQVTQACLLLRVCVCCIRCTRAPGLPGRVLRAPFLFVECAPPKNLVRRRGRCLVECGPCSPAPCRWHGAAWPHGCVMDLTSLLATPLLPRVDCLCHYNDYGPLALQPVSQPCAKQSFQCCGLLSAIPSIHPQRLWHAPLEAAAATAFAALLLPCTVPYRKMAGGRAPPLASMFFITQPFVHDALKHAASRFGGWAAGGFCGSRVRMGGG